MNESNKATRQVVTGAIRPNRPVWRWLAAFWLLLALVTALPAAAQTPGNGISDPPAGAVVSGVVIVRGTAAHSSFLRYELAFLNEGNTAAGWIVFADGDTPVRDGTLALWDTAVGRSTGAPVFPDGSYQLRLRVVRNDYNYDEYFVTGIVVSNDEPTPTPTPESVPTSLPVASATPVSAEDAGLAVPAVLPTLTPFPTPSPVPTVAGQTVLTVSEEDGDAPGGLLAEWQALDHSQFGRAFWRGAGVAAAAFGLLGLYLIVRHLVRLLWRFVLENW